MFPLVSVEVGRGEGTAVAFNYDLSFFINIPDNVWPRLEPEHTLRDLTHLTEIHHMGQKVEQRHDYEGLHMWVCEWRHLQHYCCQYKMTAFFGLFTNKESERRAPYTFIGMYLLRESQVHKPFSSGPSRRGWLCHTDPHATQNPTLSPLLKLDPRSNQRQLGVVGGN